MGKLIYVMNTSLDGYVEDADGSLGWASEDKEVSAAINDLSMSVGTFLYGRKMYEAMVYWESEYAARDLPPYMLDWARLWQDADKIVYSRTLAEPSSARTRIVRTFDAEAVRQLKTDATRDLMINGPQIAAHALRAGLVDEVHIFVWPAVVGGGKRLFPDGARLDLKLVEERAFRNGVVALRYAVTS